MATFGRVPKHKKSLRSGHIEYEMVFEASLRRDHSYESSVTWPDDLLGCESHFVRMVRDFISDLRS